MGEGLLILLLICLPLTWTVLLIVAVCQNSGLAAQTRRALEFMEKRLDRQQGALLQALGELRSGSARPAAPPPDLQAVSEAAAVWAAASPPPIETLSSVPEEPAAGPSLPDQTASEAAPPYYDPSVPEAAVLVKIPPPPPLPTADAPPLSDGPHPAGLSLPPIHMEAPPLLEKIPELPAGIPEEFVPPEADPSEPFAAGTPLAAESPASPDEARPETGRPAEADQPAAAPVPDKPPTPPEPDWLERSWQSTRDFLMRDGHFWVVAGVFVLFLGASFFVRHGIAMGWFPPALRLAATFAAGLILTGVGLAVRLRESRREALASAGPGSEAEEPCLNPDEPLELQPGRGGVRSAPDEKSRQGAWSLVVQGCGLALMYLTVVASVRVYGLVGQTPALTVMTVLVAVTAVLALWQNSQIVAHLSIVAGFVAPLLVSTNSGNYVGLFSFYIVLNLGILGMCLVRPWRRLYLTGFSLSFGIFGLWVSDSYRPEFFSSSVPFLIAFYLFYVFIGLYTARDISLKEEAGEPSSGLLSDDTASPADPRTGVIPTVVGHNPGLLSDEAISAADSRTGVTPTVVGHNPGLLSDEADLNRRPSIRQYPHGSGFRTDLTLTVMAPVLFLSTLAAMAYKPYTLSIAAALSGVMYLALFFALRRRYLPPLTSRIIMWQGVIVLNLGLALFLFDLEPEALSRWTILSLTWSVEGALLHYIGRTKPRLESVYFGFGCLALAALFAFGIFLDWHGRGVGYQFLIAGLVLGGALLHAAWADLVFDREGRPLEPGQPPLIILALAAWGVFPVIDAIRLGNLENYQYGLSWLTTVWSLLAVALWGLTRRLPVLLTIGPGPQTGPLPAPLLITARLAAFIVVLGQAQALLGDYLAFNPRWAAMAGPFEAVAWALFFASQALAIRQVRAYRPAMAWVNIWGVSLVLAAAWLLFSLAARLNLPEPLPELARLLVVLAGLALIVFPPARAVRAGRAFTGPLTCALAALALWRFTAMINDPAMPVWMPYLPVLNTIDLFQAAAVILSLAALYKLAQAERPDFARPLVYALGILLFVWLNLVLGRAVYHYAGVPYHAEALFRSGYFQSLAALAWGVVGIGAMITGHRAARRTQWLLGAILLVADLAKIFFIDLSKVGTVARIVSFLAVGTLLILVGYFAPLPPAAAEKPDGGGNEPSGADDAGEKAP